MTSLYLLAHQDDEIGVLSDISAAVRRSEPVQIVYLTNGHWAGVDPEERNRESLAVLSAIGVSPQAVNFLGTDLPIPDGRLVENLERCAVALEACTTQHSPLRRIVMHAWEGGHHDHDAVHLVGLSLAVQRRCVESTRQFPLYCESPHRRWMAFSTPSEANGPVERIPIPLWQRIRNLALLRHYRSQFYVISRLGPMMARDYVMDGCQKLQPVSIARIHQQPNGGALLYERRGLYTWTQFEQHAAPFIARHLPLGALSSV